MEQNKVEILEALNNEKMYSLRGDEVRKICSPEGDNTCGDGCNAFSQKEKTNEENIDISNPERNTARYSALYFWDNFLR